MKKLTVKAPAPVLPPAVPAVETPEQLKVRSQTCLEEINAVLKKHRCSVGIQQFIDDMGAIQSQWGVKPL